MRLYIHPKLKSTPAAIQKIKFLELAVTAEASCIITGDQDLLVLQPFDDIQILSAADF